MEYSEEPLREEGPLPQPSSRPDGSRARPEDALRQDENDDANGVDGTPKRAKRMNSPPSPHRAPTPPGSGLGHVGEGDVDPDESAFLDGVAHLAELEGELNEVKTRLAKGRPYVPLKLFRHRNKISVTDISSHLWCSAKLEYKYLHPHLKRTQQWRQLAERGSEVQLKTEEMKQGTAVHLKKELDVHEIVKVEMETEEDQWAVKLLNTYTQLAAIKSGELEREITVFGDPFSEDIMIHGVIDQLQYSPSTGEFILLDFKTRKQKSMPYADQKKGNALQLMMYKCLLDDLTCGKTSCDTLHQHLALDFSRPLTSGPLAHIEQCGLGSLFGNGGKRSETVTFGEVAKRVTELIIGLDLPLVSSLILQYEHQSTGEVIGVDDVEYREDWMREQVASALKFWTGKQVAIGVNVEDAWKCRSCQFREVCVWKKRRELERSPAAVCSQI